MSIGLLQSLLVQNFILAFQIVQEEGQAPETQHKWFYTLESTVPMLKLER